MSNEVQRYITGIMTPVEMANPGPASISARQTVVVTYDDYAALEAECERLRGLFEESEQHLHHWQRQAAANGRSTKAMEQERDALAAELAAIRAAGGEQVEVVAWMWRDLNGDVQFNYMHPEGQELMTVAQHQRIVSQILGAAKDDQPE